MDFLCLCIRVPKCGSSSLNHALSAAFADRRTFFLPDTLNLDGRFSAFQRWRFRRAGKRALRKNYGDPHLSHAVATINAEAKPGDLISGGHFDFGFAREALKAPVRIITMLRHPVDRCVSEYNYARQGYVRRDIFRRIDSKAQPKVAARYSLVGYLDWMLERREAYGDLASQLIGWDGAAPLKAYFAANVFHGGVLEDAGAFAFGLSEKLGRPVDFPWDNSTLTRKAEGADTEARRRIEQLYARDFELYEHQLAETRRGVRLTSARRAAQTEAGAAPIARRTPPAAAHLN